MSHDWEENSGISMTGHGGAKREPLNRNSQSYFSPPVLDPEDKREKTAQQQNGTTEKKAEHTDVSWNMDKNNQDGNHDGHGKNNENDGNGRKLAIALIAVLAVAILAFLFWPCSHEWVDATCTTAKVCSKCEETDGSALGHQWKNATCTDPSVCSRCKETTGTALGHSWKQFTEKDCVEAKVVSYSQCTVCKKREGQRTENLTNLLSEDGKTFLITPVEFGERLNAMCADQRLYLTCRWTDKINADNDPGIEINEGSDLPALVWLYGGSDINKLNAITEKDKNKESAISMMRLLIDGEYSEMDELLTAFVMAIEPMYENDPETAYAIAVKAFQEMQTQHAYAHGDLVYSMDVTDGLLILHVYTRAILD